MNRINEPVKEKKTVAILANSLGCGGAERVISRIAPGLSEKYDFYIILIDGSMNFYNCDSRIIALGDKEESNRIKYVQQLLSYRKRLAKIVNDYDIDCIVSFLPVPNILNLSCKSKCKRIMNVRCAADFDKYGSLTARIKHQLEIIKAKNADAAIVPSKVLKCDVSKEYNISEERISVIYNPYDVYEIEKKSIEKTEVIKDGHKFIITTMGRLDSLKGFEYLIRAVALISANHNPVKLLIIGDGDQREELTKLINVLNLDEVVNLCGSKTNPFSIISKSDVFVMSSLTEGFPNSLVEAMACKVPVISTDCKTGPREILYDNPSLDAICEDIEYADYGVLVPCFDRDGENANKCQIMATAIQKFIDDKDLCSKYGQKAYERASQFTMDKCINGYCEVIDLVINS